VGLSGAVYRPELVDGCWDYQELARWKLGSNSLLNSLQTFLWQYEFISNNHVAGTNSRAFFIGGFRQIWRKNCYSGKMLGGKIVKCVNFRQPKAEE
jgi:hypothetical protein